MGTIFVAGSYGVGKSTLCSALSKILAIPAYSAGDLISIVNGEQYGANKAVKIKKQIKIFLPLRLKRNWTNTPRYCLLAIFVFLTN